MNLKHGRYYSLDLLCACLPLKWLPSNKHLGFSRVKMAQGLLLLLSKLYLRYSFILRKHAKSYRIIIESPSPGKNEHGRITDEHK